MLTDMGQMKDQDPFRAGKKSAHKAAVILVLAILIAASIIFGKTMASSSKFHADRIAYLEEKRDNAKALIGGVKVTEFLIYSLDQLLISSRQFPGSRKRQQALQTNI